ncbi:hypothetical protein [Pseudomonas ekonensis]|uniref:hypothetical protein n=1 Tax=Pseudomonas ekonensis TaxID=2842353 RepID=UPI001CED4EEE|nr:hypothetical protein [Pseudomonas ekonensis]
MDLTETKVGEASAAGNNWNVQVNLEPGQRSLVVQQIVNNRPSVRSIPRAFKIRPPALTAVTATPSGTSVKFTGAGHTGATVQISVVSGPGGMAPPNATVTSGRWETTASNWPFGTYQLRAIQKVPDNAGGWIESLPYAFTVSHVFPDPYEVTFTRDYQPTFSGKGFTGARVRLYDEGGATQPAPEAPVVGGQWSSRASQVWGPTWLRPVHIKQFLNGQESPNWITVNVTIAPLAPTINPPVEDGLSPQLSGTCWPGAWVNITFSDRVTVHNVIGAGGTWSFRRPTDFAPEVTHTVTVTQTAANQTSPEASQTFSVVKPVPKPIITYPANNAEVGRDLTVRGQNGMAGATLQLRDAKFDRPLGAPVTLSRDGEWEVDLRTLAFGPNAIDAQQVRNNRPSERSDQVSFDVVLLSPVIEVPAEGQKLSRTSTLSGTGMKGGLVEVMLRDPDTVLLSDLEVGGDGRWQGEVTLPVGNKVLTVRQTFDGQTSQYSARRTYSVVPPAPYVETPAEDEHVGRHVTVSGFATPGDTVTVRLGTGQHSVQARTPVLEDRTWSVTLDFDVPGGRHGVLAVASSEGFDSQDSATRTVRLGTFMPVFEQPGAGRWVTSPVLFSGQGKPGNGRVLSWYNPDLRWTPAIPVTAAGWQGTAQQALPPGGHWCRFVQDISEGTTVSDWADSQRFEVPPE